VLLTNVGGISAQIAKERAVSDRVTQDRLFESDFDRTMKALEERAIESDDDE
jgi:hypothetical protein